MKLTEKYPWLKVNLRSRKDYLSPKYYNEILKDYSFGGFSDLEILERYIKSNPNSPSNLLELGCGSGRATSVISKSIKGFNSYLLVDLSPMMISFVKSKFCNKKRIFFKQNDIIDFLGETNKKFDAVFAIWSFSHSVHQYMLEKGVKKASKLIRSNIKKFIKKNLNSGGTIFMIHYDILSEEQEIINPHRLMLWKKVLPSYNLNQQSPSKRLFDSAFGELVKQNFIEFKVRRHRGEAIVYNSLNEALEVFMNFHMETYFNNHKNVRSVIERLTKDINVHKKGSKFYIKPGCFIYEVRKLVSTI